MASSPEQIGPFHVGRRLRRGPGWAVYETRDRNLLITLMEGAGARPRPPDGFVPIETGGEHEGRAYWVSPRLAAIPASTLVVGDPLQAVRVVLGAARSLAAAGIVHGHLVPANLLVVGEGVLIEGLGRRAGPSSYMSPEQAAGEDPDVRSDVYTLGASLYHLACGKRPFGGDDLERTSLRIATEEPIAPRRLRGEVSPALEAVILKAMQKNPSRRYGGVAAFAADLERVLAGKIPIATRRPRRAWVAAAATVAVAAGLLLRPAAPLPTPPIPEVRVVTERVMVPPPPREDYYEQAIERGVPLDQVLGLDPKADDALSLNDHRRMADELPKAPPERRGEILFRLGRIAEAKAAIDEAGPPEGRLICRWLTEGLEPALASADGDSSPLRLARACLRALAGRAEEALGDLFPVLADRSDLPVILAIRTHLPFIEHCYSFREREAIRANHERLTARPPDMEAMERTANRRLRILLPLLVSAASAEWKPSRPWREAPVDVKHRDPLPARRLAEVLRFARDPLVELDADSLAAVEAYRARCAVTLEAQLRRMFADRAGWSTAPPTVAGLDPEHTARIAAAVMDGPAPLPERVTAARLLERVAPGTFALRVERRDPACFWALPADDLSWLEAPDAVRSLIAATRAGRDDAFDAVDDPDPDVRSAARLCVGARGGGRALETLVARAEDPVSLHALFEEPIAFDDRLALWQALLPADQPPAALHLHGPSPALETAILAQGARWAAERYLPCATAAFVELIAARHPDLLERVPLIVPAPPEDPYLKAALRLMSSNRPDVRRAATVWTMRTGLLEAFTIVSLLNHPDPVVAVEALAALESRHDARAEERVFKAFGAARPLTRRLAVRLTAVWDAREKLDRAAIERTLRDHPGSAAVLAAEARGLFEELAVGERRAETCAAAGGLFYDAGQFSFGWSAEGVHAPRLLELARRAQPVDPENLAELARLYLDAGRPESADSCLRDLRQQPACEKATWSALQGRLLLARNDPAGAVRELEASWGPAPSLRTALDLALAYDQTNRPAEALAAIDRAADLDAAAHLRRGRLLRRLGRDDEAAAAFVRAASLGQMAGTEDLAGLTIPEALRPSLETDLADPDASVRAAAFRRMTAADFRKSMAGPVTRALQEGGSEEFAAAARLAATLPWEGFHLLLLSREADDDSIEEAYDRAGRALLHRLGRSDPRTREAAVARAIELAPGSVGARRRSLLALATLDLHRGTAAAQALLEELPARPSGPIPTWLLDRLGEFEEPQIRLRAIDWLASGEEAAVEAGLRLLMWEDPLPAEAWPHLRSLAVVSPEALTAATRKLVRHADRSSLEIARRPLPPEAVDLMVAEVSAGRLRDGLLELLTSTPIEPLREPLVRLFRDPESDRPTRLRAARAAAYWGGLDVERFLLEEAVAAQTPEDEAVRIIAAVSSPELIPSLQGVAAGADRPAGVRSAAASALARILSEEDIEGLKSAEGERAYAKVLVSAGPRELDRLVPLMATEGVWIHRAAVAVALKTGRLDALPVDLQGEALERFLSVLAESPRLAEQAARVSGAKWRFHTVMAHYFRAVNRSENAVSELASALQEGHPKGRALLDQPVWDPLQKLGSFEALRHDE